MVLGYLADSWLTKSKSDPTIDVDGVVIAESSPKSVLRKCGAQPSADPTSFSRLAERRGAVLELAYAKRRTTRRRRAAER